MNACMCAFAPYNIPNQHTIGYDVVCTGRNRLPTARRDRRSRLLRGRSVSTFGEENRHGPAANCGSKNAARAGTPMITGQSRPWRYAEPLEALVNHPAYKTPPPPTRGACGSGYWFNGGGESSASVQVNEDGTVSSPPAALTSAAREPRWH